MVKPRGPLAASVTPKKRSSSITSSSDVDLSAASHVLRDSSRTSVDLEHEDEDTLTESDFEIRPRPRSQRVGAGPFRGTRSIRRKRQLSPDEPDERESSPDEIPARPPKRVRTGRDLETAPQLPMTLLVKLKLPPTKLARFAKRTAAGESSSREPRGSEGSSDEKPPQPPLNSTQSTTQDEITVAARLSPDVDRSMPPPSFGKGRASASSGPKGSQQGREADVAADLNGQRGTLNIFSSNFGRSNNSSATRGNAIDRMPSQSEPPCQALGARSLQVGALNLFAAMSNNTHGLPNVETPPREPTALDEAHLTQSRPSRPLSISNANDLTRTKEMPPTTTPRSPESNSAQPNRNATSSKQGTPSSAAGNTSDLFENADIGINWGADVYGAAYLGMEDCATVEEFFQLVEEHRPLPLQGQRIKALAIDTVTQIEGPKVDCRIIRDDRLGRAGLRRMKKILAKQCQELEELELKIRVEWE